MGKDLFSNLPDQILCRIVSFLPNESSLETSLLSTRWRDLWNEALVKHGTQEDIIGVVADFITNFEEFDPLKHPRKLQFHFAEESVVSVTVANNSKLMLDFSPWKEEIPIGYELEFKLSKQHIATYQSFPSTFSVKTLHLKSVSCFTSEVAASIVSNLEHLENLVVIDCKGLESLSVDSTSELHKLTILDCLELKTLRLKTSKLKSFRYRGPLPLIRPEYHFNLSNAMLDFRLGLSCSGLKAKDFDATLLTIKNSEVLTLCKWTFEELIWPSISPLSGSFKFYKLRELWWIDNYNKDESNKDALFSFLKLCPSLEQLFVTNDPESYLAGGSNSCVVKGTKCTGMEHLKVIKFMGFSSRRDEISLAKCLIHLIKGKPPKIKTSDGNCLDAMFVE
ncbi:F-box protein [Glycine soja]